MARRDVTWEVRNWTYIETSNPNWYDVLINGTNKYLNFNMISGDLWYGFRDNNGVMEYKDNWGDWTPFSWGWWWWVTSVNWVTGDVELTVREWTPSEWIGWDWTELIVPIFDEASSQTGMITTEQYSVLKHKTIHIPVPTVKMLWVVNDSIRFLVTYNPNDYWMSDYEPEVYLYMKKKKTGSHANIWERTRKRYAHNPKTDNSTNRPISLKQDVNPKLYVKQPFIVQKDTEWLIDNGTPTMTTIIEFNMFQFLWSDAWSSFGTGSFPINRADWWLTGTGTEAPSTLRWSKRSSVDIWESIAVQNFVIWFTTVIRNPDWPTTLPPLESAMSETFVVYPWYEKASNTTFTKRKCNYNWRNW